MLVVQSISASQAEFHFVLILLIYLPLMSLFRIIMIFHFFQVLEKSITKLLRHILCV